MMKPVRQFFAWLKVKRTTKCVIGYFIHMIGWFTCLYLTFYWGRAWLHLLDTFEAAATAYKWSRWHGYYWLEALIEVPIHIFSEPIYCLQILIISLIFSFTVNKDGYYNFGSGTRHTGMGGAGLLATWMIFRR